MAKSPRRSNAPAAVAPVPIPPAAPHLRVWRWASMPLIVVATVVAYHNTFDAKFVFDDVGNVAENAEVRKLWPLWHAMWSQAKSGAAGRPVFQLSLAANYAIGGLEVAGYHAVNLALHAGTALLMFVVLRRTLAARFVGAADGPALAATLVWAVHPLLTNSVTYISSRTELLVAFFFLLTLYFAIRVMESTARRARTLFTAAAVVACALGAGSKELMAAAPILIVLYDCVFVAGSLRRLLRERVVLHACLFLTVLTLVPFNLSMADFHRYAIGPQSEVSSWDYLKIQCRVLARYLRLSFWPDELAVDYQGWALRYPLQQVWPAGLLIVGLLLATAYGLFRRRAPAAFAGAWCFVILAPTSSILPLQTEVGTERRMYLPLMAIAALTVVAGYRLLAAAGKYAGALRLCAPAVVAVLVAVEIQFTIQRNGDYQDPILLWADTARIQPLNPRAWSNLGDELRHQQHFEAARNSYLKSLALYPANVKAHISLGEIYRREGNVTEAIRQLQTAVEMEPANATARATLAGAYLDHGELAEAEKHAREAVALKPDRWMTHVVLANIFSARRKYVAAEAAARAAIAIDAESALARDSLGVALAGLGRDRDAVEAFRDAMRLSASPESRLHLAWQLAAASDPSVRDVKEATDLASRAAAETTRTDPYALDTLALAYAADGRFAEAAETAKAAHDIARTRGLPRGKFIEDRMKAYARNEMPAGELREFGR